MIGLKIAVILGLVVLVMMPVLSAQEGDCIALITDIRGNVSVRRAGMSDFTRCRWGTQLYESDCVKTDASGGVAILFNNGNLINLGPGGTITVARGPSSLSSGVESARALEGDLVADLSPIQVKRASDEDLGALAGLRSGETEKELVLISPCRTMICTQRPSFSWNASKSFENFKVTLYNSEGSLWSVDIKETMISYPEDEPPLEFGQYYFWNVEGEQLIDTYKSESIGFSVLSKEEIDDFNIQRKRIEAFFEANPESPTYRYLIGLVYERKGMLDEAIRSFEDIARSHTDSPILYETLGRLYHGKGQKDKAIAALQKAIELGQQNL